MKLIKSVVAILLAVIFGFVTRYFMSSINYEIVDEFTPIPHFFPTVSMSYNVSLVLLIVIFLLIFSYLMMKKYFNFAISLGAMIIGLVKYRTVMMTFPTRDMSFVPAILEFGMILCLGMAIGIVVQWVVDGGVAAIKLVNKNKN